ncbi:MAG TPA: TetR/AcrR family transcriptional regulator [Ktedonobacterales bacterium]|jgi:TetR/AcrR family transcriptional repressor of nem operon|nr:TetR/AcrR family transcriptional regulator [Ktedonobacterales bacterium]
MRYSSVHKARTRHQILTAAARALRARGISGVGIGDVMRGAGLTHGGFYAHFDSKSALVAEACAQGMAETSERLLGAAVQVPQAEALEVIIDAYLSPAHRDHPATGCVLPALASEIAREGPDVRNAFTRALEQLVTGLSSFTDGHASGGDSHDDALALMASLLGTLLLARAVDDPILSERMLRAARAAALGAFGPPS